jgi:hypothetical protein
MSRTMLFFVGVSPTLIVTGSPAASVQGNRASEAVRAEAQIPAGLAAYSRLPSPGADVAAASPVPAQLWVGWAECRCRCGRAEPSPGADMAAVSPVLVQMRMALWQSIQLRSVLADVSSGRRKRTGSLPSGHATDDNQRTIGNGGHCLPSEHASGSRRVFGACATVSLSGMSTARRLKCELRKR